MKHSSARAAAFDAPQPAGNPYLDAARTWDGRLGDAVLAKRNWQIAAAGLLLSNLILIGVVAWQASRSSIEPVLVMIDDLRETPLVVPARDVATEPGDPLIEASLARWIEDVRARPLDRVLLRKRLERAYGYLQQDGRRWIDAYFAENDPFALAKDEAIAVEILSVTKETAKDGGGTWRARWRETTWRRGVAVHAQSYHAVLTARPGRPRSAAELLDNPGSLRLTAVGWSPELVGARPPSGDEER